MRRFPALPGLLVLALLLGASARAEGQIPASSSSSSSSATQTGAQLPAGTHSVEDTARSDAAASAIREAEQDLEQKDYPAAERILRQLAEARPHDAQVQYDLGFAAERNGHEPEAAAAYRSAIAADASLAEAHVALGLLEARAGHVEAAHEQLRAATQVANSAPEVRGRALRALANLDEANDPASARQELVEALKLTPETPLDTLMGAELAEQAGDARAAETEYRKVLAEVPDEPNAAAGLAHVLEQQSQTAAAETLLVATLKVHPDDPRLLAQLGSVDAELGRPQEAVALLEQARAHDAALVGDAALSRLLARLKSMSGDAAGAAALYQALSAASPKDPELLDALGSEQVRLGQYPQAAASLRQAVALRSGFPTEAAWAEAEGHLAFVLSKTGDPAGCLQALAARATVLPNTPVTLFLEATAEDALHQAPLAERDYRAFLAASAGKFPDQEFEARHRLVALEHGR